MTALATAFVRLRIDGSAIPGEIEKTMTTAGATAGTKFSKAMTPTATSGAAKAGTSIGSALERGAVTSGLGYGKRFGASMKGSIGEYAKQTGALLVGFFAFEKVKELAVGIAEQGEAATKAMELTNAVLKSTGGIANVTGEDVAKLAEHLSNVTGVEDDTIRSSENLLLTFRNVRNEVGKNNDIFNRAETQINNIAAAMAGAGSSDGVDSLKGATIQVGKALNDPIRGLSLLGRVGVTFTETQKEIIAKAVANNNILRAQKVVLGELSAEFGGAAASQATWAKKAQAEFQNLEQELGLKLMPIMEDVSRFFATDGIDALKSFGGVISTDVLPPVKALTSVAGEILGFFDGLPDSVKDGAIAVGLLAGGIKLLTPLAIGATKSLQTGMTLAAVATLEANDAVLATDRSLKGMALTTAKAGKALLGSKAGAFGLAIGLEALNAAVGDSNKELHSLLTVAGAAATGFAVGGPWGAAVGAGVGIIQLFGEAHKNAEEDISSLQSTLNEETGAITKNTATWVANKLVTDDLVSSAKTLGLSTKTVVSAFLEQGDSAEKLTDKLKAIADSGTTITASGRSVATTFTDQAKAANTLLEALGQNTSELDTARERQKLTAETTQEATKAFEGQSEAIGATEKALAQYNQQAADLLGRSIGLHQAILDATKAIKEQKNGFDRTTQAGLDNLGVIKDIADSTEGYTSKTKAGRKALDDAAESIIRFAHAQGASIPEAKGYAEKLLGISGAAIDIDKNGDPHVTIHYDDGGAPAKLTALQRLATAIDGTVIDLFTSITGSGSIPTPAHHKMGGQIRSRIPGDNVPIYATNREWIMPVSAVDKYGPTVMTNIQQGRYASGGQVGQAATAATSGSSSGGPQRIVLDLGEGLKLRGVIRDVARDEIDQTSAYDRRLEAMRG